MFPNLVVKGLTPKTHVGYIIILHWLVEQFIQNMNIFFEVQGHIYLDVDTFLNHKVVKPQYCIVKFIIVLERMAKIS